MSIHLGNIVNSPYQTFKKKIPCKCFEDQIWFPIWRNLNFLAWNFQGNFPRKKYNSYYNLGPYLNAKFFFKEYFNLTLGTKVSCKVCNVSIIVFEEDWRESFGLILLSSFFFFWFKKWKYGQCLFLPKWFFHHRRRTSFWQQRFCSSWTLPNWEFFLCWV